MTQRVRCPICDWESEETPQCPCCGWVLISEALILAPEDMGAEYNRRLEEARDRWRRLIETFQAGAWGHGRPAVTRLEEELRAAGFSPGSAFLTWITTHIPKSQEGILQVVSEIGPLHCMLEGSSYEVPFQIAGLEPGPRRLFFNFHKVKVEIPVEVPAGSMVRLAVTPALLEAIWREGSWSFLEVARLRAPAEPVWALAFHPEGQWLAAGVGRGILELWEIPGGAPVAQWRAHLDWVRAIAFSPDGRWLASAGFDQTVKLWDVRNRQEVRRLEGLEEEILALAFHPNGRWLAAAGENGRIVLWDVQSGQELRRWTGGSGSINSIAIHPQGRWLLSGGEDGLLQLWEIDTGQLMRQPQRVEGSVYGVAFHPEGHLFAWGGSKGSLGLGAVANWEEITQWSEPSKGIRALAFHPTGQLLLSAGKDAYIRAWKLFPPSLAMALPIPAPPVWALAISPDGNYLAAGASGPEIPVWQVQLTFAPHEFLREWPLDALPPKAWAQIHTSADAELFLDGQPAGRISGGFLILPELPPGLHHLEARATDAKGAIELDVQPGMAYRVEIPLRPIRATLRFSGPLRPASALIDGQSYTNPQTIPDLRPGLKELRIALPHGEWQTWVELRGEETVEIHLDSSLIRKLETVRRWEEVPEQGKTRGPVPAIAFDRKGKQVVVASWEGELTITRFPSGTSLSLPCSPEQITALAFHSSDPSQLVTGGKDGEIQFWDTRTGKVLRKLEAHTGPVLALAFHPNGRILASGGADGPIRLWEIRTGREVQQLTAHPGPVQSLAFSPDGRSIASGGTDGGIRIWEEKTGRLVFEFKGHTGSIRTLIFSRDGKRLIAIDDEGALRCWDVQTGQEVWRWTRLRVRAASFHPTGQILAVIGGAGQAWALDASRGWILRELPGTFSGASVLTFDRSGQRLAVGAEDGQVRFWQTGMEGRPAKPGLPRRMGERARALLFMMMFAVLCIGLTITMTRLQTGGLPSQMQGGIPAPSGPAAQRLQASPSPPRCVGGISTKALQSYLSCQGSPLTQTVASLVQTAAAYNIDPRWLVAIAGAASSFGREGRCARERNNPWGLGGEWPNCRSFPSLKESLQEAAFLLWQQIHRRGVRTVEELAQDWCVRDCRRWVAEVSRFYQDQDGNPQAGDWSYFGNTQAPPTGIFRPGQKIQSSADNLRVREGPGLRFRIIGRLARGEEATILGGPVSADGYNWWAIRTTKNVVGWSVENALAPVPSRPSSQRRSGSPATRRVPGDKGIQGLIQRSASLF